MSRRARGSRRVPGRGPGNIEEAPRLVGPSSSVAAGPSIREQLEDASPAARAVLPVRFFFGLTFLYAGIDKLIDPAFFNASSPSGIVAQLTAFERVSPLSPLIHLAQPLAIPIGLLIALGEIAIGLGALTGLAFRLAAAGGAAVSLLFFLTASWTTHPYYYGPDLPYAVGWIALTIAGDGGLLVPRAVQDLGATLGELPWATRATSGGAAGVRPPAYLDEGPSPERRMLLQAGLLGAASIVVASLSVPLRVIRGGDDKAAAGGDGTTAHAGSSLDPGPGSSPATNGGTGATASVSPTATGTGTRLTGLTVATIAQVDRSGALRIRIPASAPSSLPAGDPALIVKLKDGSYGCFDAICTHEGCRVGWDAQDAVMLCPCHGAAFDPNAHAAVLGGPTNTPLQEFPLVIDHQAGTISLKA